MKGFVDLLIGMVVAAIMLALMCWLICTPARGQWGGSGCAVPGAGPAPSFPSYPIAPSMNPPMVTTPSQPHYEWKPMPGIEGQFALMRDGRQIGAWCGAERYYRSYDRASDTWGEKMKKAPITPPAGKTCVDGCKCACKDCAGCQCVRTGNPCQDRDNCTCVPVKCCSCDCEKCDGECECRKTGKPCGDAACRCVAVGDTNNFGVDPSKMRGGTRYHLGDKEVSRAAAMAAIEEDSIPADQTKFQLVVIGSPEDRARVLSEIDAILGEFKDKVVIQSYPPDSPLVSQRKYVTQGKPVVYLQAPCGVVLGRNKGGSYPGAEKAARAISTRISSFDPRLITPREGEYDPSKDPELFASDPPPTPPTPKPQPSPEPPGPAPQPKPVNPDQPVDPSKIPPHAWALGILIGVGLLLWLSHKN